MLLTTAEFVSATGCSFSASQTWLAPTNTALDKWQINTRQRAAGFLAQMAHESGKFTKFEESLSYSAMGLAVTWPNRYSFNPKVSSQPNPLAYTIERQPEKIANLTYADRMGNGNTASGDGWKYRGRGPKQITGKENYQKLSDALGIDFVADPELLLLPENGAASAGWYWKSHGCNQLQDQDDFKGVTMKINGGLIGYDQRVMAWERAKKALGVA